MKSNKKVTLIVYRFLAKKSSYILENSRFDYEKPFLYKIKNMIAAEIAGVKLCET
ncbi:MAG: hypothetical protein II270_07150 [Peptococcaceae bacterium]|nr:hypothetical protein [Peptococcaceae bacterium]